MITSIEIKERTWNEEKQHYELKYKTITRDEYGGDFDELILDNMNNSEIRDYAEDELDMIPKTNAGNYCDCRPSRDPEDFNDEDLIQEIEERGHKVIYCQTLADSMKLEKLKQIMEIS